MKLLAETSFADTQVLSESTTSESIPETTYTSNIVRVFRRHLRRHQQRVFQKLRLSLQKHRLKIPESSAQPSETSTESVEPTSSQDESSRGRKYRGANEWEASTEEPTTQETTPEETTTEEPEWSEQAPKRGHKGTDILAFSEDGQTVSITGFDGSRSVVEIPANLWRCKSYFNSSRCISRTDHDY